MLLAVRPLLFYVLHCTTTRHISFTLTTAAGLKRVLSSAAVVVLAVLLRAVGLCRQRRQRQQPELAAFRMGLLVVVVVACRLGEGASTV